MSDKPLFSIVTQHFRILIIVKFLNIRHILHQCHTKYRIETEREVTTANSTRGR